jgi:hypothetical protein
VAMARPATELHTAHDILSDANIAKEVLDDNIVLALTRVLKEGSLEGKISSSRSLPQLLNHYPLSEVLSDYSQCCFIIHALLVCLSGMSLDNITSSEPLDVLALMSRTKDNECFSPSLRTAFLEIPESLEPLVRCVIVGFPPIQDKPIQILATLCLGQPSLLGEYLNRSQGCIVSLATRVMESTETETRINSAVTLISAMRDSREQLIDVLESSKLLKDLISALVNMLKEHSSSTSMDIEVCKPYTEKSLSNYDQDVLNVPELGKVREETVALWLLAFICSHHARSKHTVMELGSVDIVSDRLASHTASGGPRKLARPVFYNSAPAHCSLTGALTFNFFRI